MASNVWSVGTVISRFNAKIGLKGRATPHHAYICGENQYTNKQGVMLTQSGNMPSWAINNPAAFWAAADEYERANGTTYKEHTLSLPRELSLEQQKIVVDRWIKQEIGDKHPYTYAIHHAQAQDGGLNPHAHLMLSKRTNDGIERAPERYFKRANKKNPAKGGAVKADTGMTRNEMRKQLIEQRERWGDHLRECLTEFGFSDLAQKIDMRNWRERGLSEPPNNKTMAEINAQKRLDTAIEQHPYYIDPQRLELDRERQARQAREAKEKRQAEEQERLLQERLAIEAAQKQKEKQKQEQELRDKQRQTKAKEITLPLYFHMSIRHKNTYTMEGVLVGHYSRDTTGSPYNLSTAGFFNGVGIFDVESGKMTRSDLWSLQPQRFLEWDKGHKQILVDLAEQAFKQFMKDPNEYNKYLQDNHRVNLCIPQEFITEELKQALSVSLTESSSYSRDNNQNDIGYSYDF